MARSATLLAPFRPAPSPTSLLPLPTAAGPRQQTTAPRHQPLGTGVPRTELQRRVDSLAARCGLTSAVMRAESAALHDDWVGGQPPIGGADLVATLRLGARDRARATFDLDRIATALEWAVELHELTGRVLFRPLQHAGDIAASIYNADSLEQLAEFIRRKGSRQRGRIGHKLASDTVDTYVSTVKTLASFEAHCQLVLPETNTILPAASKRDRQQSAPPGERAICRGIRASHLRRLAAMGYDRSSARGMLEWAAALVAWNLLLRGGEIGHVARGEGGDPFDPTRDPTFGAIEFRVPCADSEGQPWLTFDIVPIKDAKARARTCPMGIRRRSRGPLGSDPLCVYDAIVMAWRSATGSSPPAVGRATGALAGRPFFIGRTGRVWDTTDTRALSQRMATALGLAATEFGAKSFRIGGATDWRDVFGPDAQRIITLRGRWASDISLIYQRALLEEQLYGSVAVASACRADLESVVRTWVQPATFR